MADISYYVALPFTEDEEGSVVTGTAEEFQSASTAIRRAETLSRTSGIIGAVAFTRSGDPMTGDFKDAMVLKTFGSVPTDLSGLQRGPSGPAVFLLFQFIFAEIDPRRREIITIGIDLERRVPGGIQAPFPFALIGGVVLFLLSGHRWFPCLRCRNDRHGSLEYG